MKKQYIIPATDVMFIETAPLLEPSLDVNEESTYVIENQDDILSRGRNGLWDSED